MINLVSKVNPELFKKCKQAKKSADSIKDIIKDNKAIYEMYFDHNRISYKEWGTHELLSYNEGYKVRKVTVYPGY